MLRRKFILFGIDSLDIATKTWLAALPKPPATRVILAVNDFIIQCKKDGNWNLFDRIWLFAQDTKANVTTSLINPSSTLITEVNSPTWSAYGGYQSNGTTSYLNTNYNPSTSSVNYTLNSCCIAAYLSSALVGAVDGIPFGCDDGTNNIYCYPRYIDNKMYVRLNASASAANTANTVTRGMFAAVRTSSTNVQGWLSGTKLIDTTQNSTVIPSKNLYLLAENNNGTAASFYVNKHSLVCVGSGALNQTKLNAAANTLQATLGF